MDDDKALLLTKVNKIIELYQDGFITSGDAFNQLVLLVLKYSTNQPEWTSL